MGATSWAIAEILHCIAHLPLGLADPLPHVADGLVGHAFIMQTLISGGLADFLLHFAFGLLQLSLESSLLGIASPPCVHSGLARMRTCSATHLRTRCTSCAGVTSRPPARGRQRASSTAEVSSLMSSPSSTTPSLNDRLARRFGSRLSLRRRRHADRQQRRTCRNVGRGARELSAVICDEIRR